MKLKKTILKFVCHRLPERSYHACGEPFILCSRCMAIYLSFLISTPLFVLFYLHNRLLPNIILIGILLLPMAYDGTTQLLKLRKSTNRLRFISGYLGGYATSALFVAALFALFTQNTATVFIPNLKSLTLLIPLFPLLYSFEHEKIRTIPIKKLVDLLIIFSVVLITALLAFLWIYTLSPLI